MDKAFPSPREAYQSGYADGQAESADRLKALEERMASIDKWVEDGEAIVKGGGTAFRIGMWWAKRPKW